MRPARPRPSASRSERRPVHRDAAGDGDQVSRDAAAGRHRPARRPGRARGRPRRARRDRRPAIPVDDQMRAAPGVWAIGDVTGHGRVHPRVDVPGGHRGRRHPRPDGAARRVPGGAAGHLHRPGDRLGRAHRGAGPRAGDATCAPASAQIPTSARGWIHKAGNDGFIKLVEDAERGVLVGATSAGPSGGEVLGVLVLAVHAQVPVPPLRQMIYAYPTFHRAISQRRAARAVARPKPGSTAQTTATPPAHSSPPDQSENRGVVTLATAPARICPADGPRP